MEVERIMRRILIFLFAAMLVCACAVSPEGPEIPLGSLGNHISDAEAVLGNPAYTETSVVGEDQVTTIKGPYTDPESGVTVLNGSHRILRADGTDESLLLLSYAEDGSEYLVEEGKSVRISAEGHSLDEEARAEAEGVLAEARRIPYDLFVEKDGKYEYHPQQRNGRITGIAIDLEHDSCSGSYIYDVEYISSDDSVLNIREEYSRKMSMTCDGRNVDLTAVFAIEFSIKGLQGDPVEVENIVLSFSDVHRSDYPTAGAAAYFAEIVEERTDGRISIDVHYGGTLYGTENEAFEAIKNGQLAFTSVSLSALTGIVPGFTVFQLPYIFSDATHMHEVLDGTIGESLLAELGGSGVVGLGYLDEGARSFYSSVPIKSADDFAGLRIRVQNLSIPKDFVAALGAVPVTSVGPGDVYYALLDDRIDGAENNWITYESMADYKAAPYYLQDEHFRTLQVMIASEEILADLSAEDVAIIRECAAQAARHEASLAEREEAAAKSRALADGAEMIVLSAAEKELLEDMAESVYLEHGSQYSNLIEAIRNE